jgi:hypothetical protein
MTSKKKNLIDTTDKKNLKERKEKRLTCLKCKNQSFLIVYGVADFPFFDVFCSACGSGYPFYADMCN